MGSNFVSTSSVDWNGSPLATTFVSGTQLQAVVPASDFDDAGTAQLTVVTPAPGGGTSNFVVFTITDAPLDATGSSSSFAATENAPTGTLMLATFVDEGGPLAVTSYRAVVIWGDNQSTLGTVTLISGSTYSVTASHVYADAGSYTIGVTIQDNGLTNNPGSQASVTDSIVVADPPVIPTAADISGVENSNTGSVILATFTDPGGAKSLSKYSATIDWGDSSNIDATGTITYDASSNTFTVTGSQPRSTGATAVTSTLLGRLRMTRLRIPSRLLVATRMSKKAATPPP
jgi:hypothetical protein